MSAETETIVDVNSARIWTCRSGGGNLPVLLCSGGPGCCDYLAPVAGMIDDLAGVYRWEQRGCGRSSADGRYDLATCLGDMEAIRRHYGIDRWIVGGHSWGANLALAYATEHPASARGLIFISGTGLTPAWRGEYRRNKAERSEALPPMAFEANMQVNKAANASYEQYTANPDLPLKVANIESPALFVHGGRDLRPAWASRDIATAMPHARFELIEEAQHVTWLTHAAELRAILRAFIRELA